MENVLGPTVARSGTIAKHTKPGQPLSCNRRWVGMGDRAGFSAGFAVDWTSFGLASLVLSTSAAGKAEEDWMELNSTSVFPSALNTNYEGEGGKERAGKGVEHKR